MCNNCGASGHSASERTQTGCSECGSTTHKSALSFACPEHKCTNCEGTLEPKGHNRNDCPRMQTTMCEECGETGDSANKLECPTRIRPCNACGLRSHKLQTSHLCPLEIDHLYILPVSAPPISAAASTSSTNTPTSTPTKQLNTRLTEINFD